MVIFIVLLMRAVAERFFFLIIESVTNRVISDADFSLESLNSFSRKL